MKKIRSLLIGISLTALVMLTGMALYEFTKQLIFPDIRIWESHIITIIFSTFIATLASFFILSKRQDMLDKLRNENIEKEKALLEKEKALNGISEALENANKMKESLKKAVDEKNFLIKEMNHRVKNNFQLVSSIIGIEKYRINDMKISPYLDNIQNRVNTMAKIHEALQVSDEISTIEFGGFIKMTADRLYEVFDGKNNGIKLMIESEKIFIGIKDAVSLGLMLNEILTNTFKYAFEGRKDGNTIIITFKNMRNGCLLFSVADNGKGIDGDLNWISADSMGMRIIKNLTEIQLEGTLEVDRRNGTKFIIIFGEKECDENS